MAEIAVMISRVVFFISHDFLMFLSPFAPDFSHELNQQLAPNIPDTPGIVVAVVQPHLPLTRHRGNTQVQ